MQKCYLYISRLVLKIFLQNELWKLHWNINKCSIIFASLFKVKPTSLWLTKSAIYCKMYSYRIKFSAKYHTIWYWFRIVIWIFKLRKILCKEFEYLVNIFRMYISNNYMTVPNVQWKTKRLNEGILKFQKDLKN